MIKNYLGFLKKYIDVFLIKKKIKDFFIRGTKKIIKIEEQFLLLNYAFVKN